MNKPTVIAQQQALKQSELYSPVKVGSEWKGKTPMGIVTRKTKKGLVSVLEMWKAADYKRVTK